MEKDETKKVERFKKCEEELEKSAQRKKEPQWWDEMDDAEKEEREIVCCDDEVSEETLKRRKDRIIKPDKVKKLQQKEFQVNEYEMGQTRHRSQLKEFYSFDKPRELKIETAKVIKVSGGALRNSKGPRTAKRT
jgi:hypothetical protein